MKYLSICILFLCSFGLVFADSNPYTDSTIIDCHDGSDTTGVPFDSSKPYKTLNDGIQNSLSYLNTTINTEINRTNAENKVFHIEVLCSTMPTNDTTISLEYYGYNYDNEVVISGTGSEGLIAYNIYFNVKRNTGNIKFQNAKLVNNSEKGYYFKGEDNVTFGYLSYPTNQQQMTFHGIKIEDSYIHIFPNTQLYGESYYRYDSNPSSSTNYVDANYSFNQLGIKNTTIEVNLIQNYTFNLPYIIKDSSLSFRNTVSTGSTYDIKLQSKGGLRDTLDFRGYHFISSELDFGGNAVYTNNGSENAYINNKLENFSSWDFGARDTNTKYGRYLNNYFVSEENLDISKVPYSFNNVFEQGYTDTTDILNLKKNFSVDNIGPKGISWAFRKLNASKYLEIDYTSASLFYEITGRQIPDANLHNYVIFY